jgi:hypothetical protein
MGAARVYLEANVVDRLTRYTANGGNGQGNGQSNGYGGGSNNHDEEHGFAVRFRNVGNFECLKVFEWFEGLDGLNGLNV